MKSRHCYFALSVVVLILTATGIGDADEHKPAMPDRAPRELYSLKKEQCTAPAESAIHPEIDPNGSLGLETGEVWFRVKLEAGHVTKSQPVYGHPATHGFLDAALDALKHLELKAPDGSGNSKDWLYHRVLVIAKYDTLTQVRDTIPVPCDSATLNQLAVVFPEMVFYPPPDYPRSAKQSGTTGLVWIKAYVKADGTVEKAMASKSSGSTLLDDAAVAAAKKNRFKPATSFGHPVAVWVTYKVEFKLN